MRRSRRPRRGAASALDLRALTARLQADSDAAEPGGGPAPAWRLFEYGPLARLVPDAGSRNPYYLVVWVADEDGLVVARAVAYGPGEGAVDTRGHDDAAGGAGPGQDSDDPAGRVTC